MKVLDFEQIRDLHISPEQMYSWTEQAWRIQDASILPPKVKMWQGESGRYITMPCVIPDYDVAGVKFISRNVDDANGIPARNSHILLQKCSDKGLLAVLDGAFITNMRTGANAAFAAINYAKKNPQTIAIYGLGLAARAFMLFYASMYKEKITVKLMRYKDQTDTFIKRFKDYSQFEYQICDSLEELFSSDIIVSCVSFTRNEFCPVEIYPKGCTIVPVQTRGFQNCDLTFNKVIVDDIGHVESYKYFPEFKDRMVRITDILHGKSAGRTDDDEQLIVYSGGIAVHDLYFAVKVLELATDKGTDVLMRSPQERFWI